MSVDGLKIDSFTGHFSDASMCVIDVSAWTTVSFDNSVQYFYTSSGFPRVGSSFGVDFGSLLLDLAYQSSFFDLQVFQLLCEFTKLFHTHGTMESGFFVRFLFTGTHRLSS